MTRQIAALAVAVGATLALAGAALADQWQIARTPKGDAAARAVVLRKTDLGTGTQWTGGAKKPDLTTSLSCPGWEPKQSDLVVTGAAETVWQSQGVQLDSAANVLKAPQMVELDWQRTAAAPQVFPCLRSIVTKGLGANATLVSMRRVAVPAIGSHSLLIRTVADVKASGGTVRVMLDSLLIATGRTELSLTTTAPYSARTAVTAAELRLGRLLASRVPSSAVA